MPLDFMCLNVDNMTPIHHNPAVFLENLHVSLCPHIRVVTSAMQVPFPDQVQLFRLMGIKYGDGVNMPATIVTLKTVSEITLS